MRIFKRILKWTGIVLLMLIVVLLATIMLRQNIKYNRPYPNITSSSDTTVIMRGRHLVLGPGHCVDCHKSPQGDSLMALGIDPPLSGGHEFSFSLGKIYTKNITPDAETGIGNYTDAEIARALRYGVHPDGTVVYNFMPYHNVSDEDLAAIISYLRAQKPVRNEVPSHELNMLGKAVKAFLVKPVGPEGEVPVSVNPDTTAAYGKYLTMNVANCNGCHTKRDMAGNSVGDPFAGGGEIEGYYPPNLTPDPTSHIYKWTESDFIARFRKGSIIPNSPMPWKSYSRMNDTELKAIYAYLRTVKPVPVKIK